MYDQCEVCGALDRGDWVAHDVTKHEAALKKAHTAELRKLRANVKKLRADVRNYKLEADNARMRLSNALEENDELESALQTMLDKAKLPSYEQLHIDPSLDIRLRARRASVRVIPLVERVRVLIGQRNRWASELDEEHRKLLSAREECARECDAYSDELADQARAVLDDHDRADGEAAQDEFETLTAQAAIASLCAKRIREKGKR